MTKKTTTDQIIKKIDELLDLLEKFDGDKQWIAQCLCSQIVDSVSDNLYQFEGILNECILLYRDDWRQHTKETELTDYVNEKVTNMEKFLEEYKDTVYPSTPELVRIYQSMADEVDAVLYNIGSDYKMIGKETAEKFNEAIQRTKYKLAQSWKSYRIANGFIEPENNVVSSQKDWS